MLQYVPILAKIFWKYLLVISILFFTFSPSTQTTLKYNEKYKNTYWASYSYICWKKYIWDVLFIYWQWQKLQTNPLIHSVMLLPQNTTDWTRSVPHTPINLTFRRQSQKDHKVEASLGYRVKQCLKKWKKKKLLRLDLPIYKQYRCIYQNVLKVETSQREATDML